MESGFRLLLVAAIFLLLHVCACKKGHQSGEIEQAMQQYARLQQKWDVDSLVLLFTPDGNYEDVAFGRSWIRRYLASAGPGKIISNQYTSDSIQLYGDSAVQKGRYASLLLFGDSMKTQGLYQAHWVWRSHTGWLLNSISLKPGP